MFDAAYCLVDVRAIKPGLELATNSKVHAREPARFCQAGWGSCLLRELGVI